MTVGNDVQKVQRGQWRRPRFIFCTRLILSYHYNGKKWTEGTRGTRGTEGFEWTKWTEGTRNNIWDRGTEGTIDTKVQKYEKGTTVTTGQTGLRLREVKVVHCRWRGLREHKVNFKEGSEGTDGTTGTECT